MLTQPTLDVAARVADADIVVGKGRAVLDGMSCGRPAFLYDAFGSDGWVTAATYDALEADAFAGQSDPDVLDADGLRAALDDYDPAMGRVNRELVLKHHQDRKHAEALVGLFRRLRPVARRPARRPRPSWPGSPPPLAGGAGDRGPARHGSTTLTGRVQEAEQQLLLSEQRRRRRARAARRAEARLAELGEPADAAASDRAPNLWVADGRGRSRRRPHRRQRGAPPGVGWARAATWRTAWCWASVTRPGRGSTSPSPPPAPTVLGEGTIVGTYARGLRRRHDRCRRLPGRPLPHPGGSGPGSQARASATRARSAETPGSVRGCAPRATRHSPPASSSRTTCSSARWSACWPG